MSELSNFYQYKSGFVDGKWTAINVFKTGNKLRFQDGLVDNSSVWYELGYKDGYDYFLALSSKNDFDIEKVDTKELQLQFFEKRVMFFLNEENNRMVDGRSKK